MDHALLSASKAKQWINCTPSIRAGENIPEKQSDYADEGSLAHKWAELLIKYRFDAIHYRDTLAEFQLNMVKVRISKYYSVVMGDHVSDFADFVLDLYRDYAKVGKTILIQEIKLNLEKFIPQSWSYVDVAIITPGILHIIDFKYGEGVEVSADLNEQLMIYALGALIKYHLYGIFHKVVMTIYQPRMSNISTFEMSVVDLYKWANQTLVRAAKQAFEGKGEFKAGTHCRWCKLKGPCKTHTDYVYALARPVITTEFNPALLNDQALINVYANIDTIRKGLNAVEEHVRTEAQKGKKWPGFKLVNGRSDRQYISEEKIEATLLKAGYTEAQIKVTKLKGITAMEKLLKPSGFKKLLGPLVIKPPGAPTLVPDTDQRDPFEKDSAKRFFSKPLENNL